MIGTDSLAGNNSLDMLEQIRHASEAHPDFPATELFKAATINGRKALGIAPEAADLAVLGLPDGAREAKVEGLLSAILQSDAQVYATISRGKVIARRA